MKKKYIASGLLCGVLLLSGCTDFLNIKPEGVLNPDQVDDPDKLVIAAYAALGNNREAGLWSWGSVRADDAYKGGGGENDGYNVHCYEISSNIKTDFGEADGFWFNMYSGISRVNTALAALNETNEKEFPNKMARIGEMRFLRGHFYFLLKVMFKNVPYIDEKIPTDDYHKISNVALSNDALWQKIADDFEFAFKYLPEKQQQIGRTNKFAAAAYLAKTRLYKAYRQDDMHNVTGIDQTDLEEVLKYTQTVMNSPYTLEPDFGFNFMPGSFENGIESIFAIQFSKDDGTMFGRLNFADFVTVPQGIGCCDFHKPSQNLVNSFKTARGLPMFDSYDMSNYDVEYNKADPRLFHTAAIPGLPYKYNENLIFQQSWNRNPAVYGNFASLKENVDPSCDCFVNLTPYYANSKNKIIIRFADVLLMRAEALIELKREQEALSLINRVRERAQKSSTGVVNYSDDLRPKMDITLYTNGTNCNWTYTYAQKALRWERRMEFAMEDSRFFDLVRWGIADQVINDYYLSEAGRRSYYKGAKFTKNKNEYVPIPLQQIGFSQGVYTQNYGW